MFSPVDVLPSDSASDRRRPVSRTDGVKLATGHVNVDPWASHGKYTTRKKPHGLWNARLATWNVRGLRQIGKLQILENELSRCKIDIAGISETHWHGKGHFRSSEYTICYSGTENKSVHGVGFMVSNRINNFVMGYVT